MTSLHLAVLTTGRQDWGILRPLCEALRADPGFRVSILAGGMACSPAFGRIVDSIRQQGFDVSDDMDWTPEVSHALAQTSAAVSAVGNALERLRPGALVLLGDRYETAAAALASTVLGIPIVHLYGGEETEAAIDNVLRHAITKLSHLHLVAHRDYADRVIQMGEDPATVHIVGSLGVDNIFRPSLPSREELQSILGIDFVSPLGLVTVHPTTLASRGGTCEVDAVVEAMKAFPATWIVTLPNADQGHEYVRDAFLALARVSPNVLVVSALGEERYLGVMREADFVLGNSSSGITEAPSLRVPTINVGDRQKGRIRSTSVIDVPCDAAAIVDAILTVASPSWRARVASQPRPFGDGDAASRIVTVLKCWIPPVPPRKVFHKVCDPARTAS